GSFTVTVTDSNGCVSGASSVSPVTVNPIPPIPVIVETDNLLSSDAASGYQWFMDTTFLTGETLQNLIISQSGTYFVEITDANGCTAMSGPYAATYTGIGEIVDNVQLEVFPNPSEGMIHLVFSAPESGSYMIELTNVIGELIYSKRLENFDGTFSHAFNLSENGLGMYFVTLTNGVQKATRKVIVY
ncbi:MAG: T9SS type A sorting domain-containing protein, partial [Flavobacteriales bacterium]|nr:T9SS type A sorting domain-containing protein [Flavobacteriales bacterium]